MKISFDTNRINYASFSKLPIREKGEKTHPVDKMKTPEEILKYRTKLAVGCVFAVAVAADILYFTIKRNIKYDNIERAKKLAIQRIENLNKNVPTLGGRFKLV